MRVLQAKDQGSLAVWRRPADRWTRVGIHRGRRGGTLVRHVSALTLFCLLPVHCLGYPPI